MVFGWNKAQHKEIAPQELAEMIENGAAVVVDVREVDEFAAGAYPRRSQYAAFNFSGFPSS
jgi:rhodanese-related sulfurtransferase